MRTRLLSLCAAALAVALLLGVPAAAAWKFASIADSRGASAGVNTAVLSAVVERINAEGVELVLFEGDAINGYCTQDCLSSEMDSWLAVMNRLSAPWFFSPGNHDIGGSLQAEDILRQKVSQPLNGPAEQQELVYSFDHRDAHFVSLNSDHPGQEHRIQQAWLEADLAATHQPHVFVFAHQPAYPAGPHIGSSLDAYPAERDRFWDVLTARGVRMYFCGHEHLYVRAGHGWVTQVINGTCGAPLATGDYADILSVYHYVVVTVDGPKVTCQAKDLNGGVIDSWQYCVTPDCDSLRLLPDGAGASLVDRPVTFVVPDALYVEEDGRSSAFRLAPAIAVQPGDRVNAAGILRTLPSGERELVGQVYCLSEPGIPPAALLMRTPDILAAGRGFTPGCSDAAGLNTSALYVGVAGRVTYVGQGWFYLDDGAGLRDGTVLDTGAPAVGVRVEWNGPVSLGHYTLVQGVCSAFRNQEGEVCRLLRAASVR